MSNEKDDKIRELEAEIRRLKEENAQLNETVRWMHDLIWEMSKKSGSRKGDSDHGTCTGSNVSKNQNQEL